VDLLPFAFLILFVLLGGVIAVIADNLGRKFGKKRLSFMGLRPKHTATVITFGAGALISLATILLVTIVSSDIRQWILEGRVAAEKARQEKRVVEGELDSRQKELGEKQKEVDRQAKRLNRLQSEIGKLQPEIVKLQSQVGEADKKVKAYEISRDRVQRDLDSRQRELKRAQALLAKNERALADVEKQRKLQEQLAQAAQRQKDETDSQNTALAQENQRLVGSIAMLQDDIARLTADTQKLVEARDKAKLDLDYADTQLSQLQVQLRSTQKELETSETQLQTARLQTEFYQLFNGQARTEPLTFSVNEEVARVQVDAGLSVRAAEAALGNLLNQARMQAIARGAKKTDRSSEAGIYDHVDPVTKSPITADVIQRQIVQKIAGSPTPLVLVASSSLNAFRNEPVSLEVGVFPNPVVYSKGQVVAESRIDGSRDTDAIYSQLEDLFRVKIRNRAIEDKMVATMGTDQFGEVKFNDIYHLLSQVKDADRLVRVQALAVDDIRAGDPLRLEYRVR
jgi:uncharacterized protein (DUF3084 family)